MLNENRTVKHIKTMKKAGVIILVLIFSSAIRLSAQKKVEQWNGGNLLQKNYYITIPYQEIGNKIIIEAVVNDKPRKFIFDTGGGSSAMISKSLSQEINMVSRRKFDVTDASNKSGKMFFFTLPLLKINELSFTDVFTAVMSDNNFDTYLSCWKVDGLLGSGLFKNSIVQIDSKKKVLIITDDSNRLQLNPNYSKPMMLHPQSSVPVISIMLHKDMYGMRFELLFDTGDDVFFSMAEGHYHYLIEQGVIVFDKLAESEGAFAIGLHGKPENQQYHLLRLQNLTVNETTFKNLVVTTTYSDNSRIGFHILKYGKTTLDYKNALFNFEPYNKIATEILCDEREWQICPTMENNKLVVGIVWDKSLNGKVNIGDEILKFDNLDYQNKTLCEIMLSPKKSDAQEADVILKDIKTNKIKTVRIKRI